MIKIKLISRDPSDYNFMYDTLDYHDGLFVIVGPKNKLIDVYPVEDIGLAKMNLEFIQAKNKDKCFKLIQYSMNEWKKLWKWFKVDTVNYRKQLFCDVKYWNYDLEKFCAGWNYIVEAHINQENSKGF